MRINPHWEAPQGVLKFFMRKKKYETEIWLHYNRLIENQSIKSCKENYFCLILDECFVRHKIHWLVHEVFIIVSVRPYAQLSNLGVEDGSD